MKKRTVVRNLRTMNQSGEDYLEVVYLLRQQAERVHSVDVVQYLNFSRSSVSAAVNLLRDGGFLTMERDGALTLTEAGTREAVRVYEKHCVIRELLDEQPALSGHPQSRHDDRGQPADGGGHRRGGWRAAPPPPRPCCTICPP